MLRMRQWNPSLALFAAAFFAWLAGSSILTQQSGYLAQVAAKDSPLLDESLKKFQPLPKDAASKEYPVIPDRVNLGRMLFFDPRISVDGTGSCVKCHLPALYGADGLPKSHAIGDVIAPRNAPTVLNSALHFKIHWDGVFANVEEQANRALIGPGFGNKDHAAAMAKIKAIPGYGELFRKAFPDQSDPVTAENWGKAIGAYERTLLTPSRFDEYLNGKTEVLSNAEQRGLKAFVSMGCVDCHNGAGIGGSEFQKFGVVDDYWKATGSKDIDKGRFNVTRKEDDMYVFKTPSLRNVAMTAPYFHDGSVKTLPEAVRIMASVQLGVNISQDELRDVVAFLGCLTGTIPASFVSAPILPAAGFSSEP